MAAGMGQESTALVSPSWPHALRLLQVGIFSVKFPSRMGWSDLLLRSKCCTRSCCGSWLPQLPGLRGALLNPGDGNAGSRQSRALHWLSSWPSHVLGCCRRQD